MLVIMVVNIGVSARQLVSKSS